jgi:hypothetical protein
MNSLTDRPVTGPAPALVEELRRAIRLDWGHEIVTPEGEIIRLPQSAFPRLRILGLLLPNRNAGLFQISDAIYAFMHPDYEGLMGGLRQVLGKEMEGPLWLKCGCRQCQEKHEEADKTPLHRGLEPKRRGRYWLKVIRANQN